MVTTVGTESELDDLLSNLITLDYDAIEAYEAAIERLEDPGAKRELGKFVQDHRRHTENLAPHLQGMGGHAPTSSGAKSLLTQGKVAVASIAGGDSAILKAMASNETDTITAYERATQHAQTESQLREKLEANLEDERQHKAWIEKHAKLV